MPDREKVIAGLTMCAGTNVPIIDDMDVCILDCPYRDKSNGCVDKLMFDALTLLKEQEAVKPVQDKKTGRVWLCGNCGSYVGFEDHDEDDPNEFDKFCRECGHPVSWEGR